MCLLMCMTTCIELLHLHVFNVRNDYNLVINNEYIFVLFFCVEIF